MKSIALLAAASSLSSSDAFSGAGSTSVVRPIHARLGVSGGSGPSSASSRLNMVKTPINPLANYRDTALPYLNKESAADLSINTDNEYTTNIDRVDVLHVVDEPRNTDYISNNNKDRVEVLHGEPPITIDEYGIPQQSQSNNLIENVLSSYIGPRVILALVAILYGTNFPLGAIMNDNLPASAATSSRMVLASIVLSPFLLQLAPSLRKQVLIGGAFVSMGYVAQSIALVDTSPALVSFLGSATVIVCPILQWLVDKKPMGVKDAPQTWLVRSKKIIDARRL